MKDGRTKKRKGKTQRVEEGWVVSAGGLVEAAGWPQEPSREGSYQGKKRLSSPPTTLKGKDKVNIRFLHLVIRASSKKAAPNHKKKVDKCGRSQVLLLKRDATRTCVDRCRRRRHRTVALGEKETSLLKKENPILPLQGTYSVLPTGVNSDKRPSPKRRHLMKKVSPPKEDRTVSGNISDLRTRLPPSEKKKEEVGKRKERKGLI